MANKSKEDPSAGPQPDRWYNLTLGNSFKDASSNKYCTLRYDFKPASIDKSKPGSLHKNKENRVTVEFQNNQCGKPKVTFEGSSEDYKENDAVLFFDSETFRLERLHRAVKQLRYVRKGESASAASTTSASAAVAAAAAAAPPPGPAVEPRLSPVGKGPKAMHGRSSLPHVPVEVERIDIAEPENPGAKPAGKGIVDPFDQPHASIDSPAPKNDEAEDHQDIDIEDIFGAATPEGENTAEQKADTALDVNEPHHHNDTDDEIADVDDSDDEAHKGRNAAEALRAQVNGEDKDDQTSSSSSSSGSGSSGSGSGSGSSSSSSDSEGSDEDSVNSV